MCVRPEKSSVVRMASDLAHELEPFVVAAGSTDRDISRAKSLRRSLIAFRQRSWNSVPKEENADIFRSRGGGPGECVDHASAVLNAIALKPDHVSTLSGTPYATRPSDL